jgi:hypothetical protein
MHPLIIIPIILKLQLVKCMFCQPTYSPSQKSGLSNRVHHESHKCLKSWIRLLRQKCILPLVWTVSKCAFISKIWYYGTICTLVQCFKNVLSFSIETDLWHKACITNITFESLLFFMNLFNGWIQRVSFCNMVHVIWTTLAL